MYFFFFQAEDGIRDVAVTGVQTCALPISAKNAFRSLHWLAISLSNESSISTARYSFPPCFQSATWVRSLFRKSWTLSLVTIGGLVFFLPTAVTVMVTVPGSAATAFATKSPNSKVIAPIIRARRLGFAFFIIEITPFTYLHTIRCTAGLKSSTRTAGLPLKSERSVSPRGMGGLLHEARRASGVVCCSVNKKDRRGEKLHWGDRSGHDEHAIHGV